MLVAMTVAGSDSIGGAGVEADIKALASQGVHAAVAVTAITAQNTQRVEDIFPLPPEQVVAQIDAILEDVHVSAVKIGMLYSAPIAAAVAERLSEEDFPIVADPVLAAGVGESLNRGDLAEEIKDSIVPLATVLTPNAPEAEALVGHRIRTDADVREACQELNDMGAEAVLLKGGHLEGATSIDTLYFNGKFLQVEVPRLEIRGHGGGCILSSYLAANLTKGMGIWEATLAAKAAINEAVTINYVIGKGAPIVDPLGRVLRDAQRYQVSTRLSRAYGELIDLLPDEWAPDAGTKMVFALPGAAGIEDVCGLEDRTTGSKDKAVLPRGVDFRAPGDTSVMVLTAMNFDGGVRSALALRFSEERLSAFRKKGFSIGRLDLGNGTERSGRSEETGTEEAIRWLGFVPDIIYYRGGPGKEPMIRLLARSPEELIQKLKRVLG